MPFRVSDHADQVVDLYHLRVAGKALDGTRVDGFLEEVCAQEGRANDFAVKHAGNPNFLRVLEGALDLGRNVDARDGFPENLPRGWIVGYGVGIHRKIKPLSLNQLAVAHRVGRISALDREDAIRAGELANGNMEVLGR